MSDLVATLVQPESNLGCVLNGCFPEVSWTSPTGEVETASGLIPSN